MWGRKKNHNKEILIFLDVDGVLNTTNSRITKYEIREENVSALGGLQDSLVKCGYSVKMILSSTWRLGYDAIWEKCSPQMQKLILRLEKVNIKLYDKTPIYKVQTRDVEIQRYLRGYQLEHEEFEYIILDDDVSIFKGSVLEEMNFYKVNECTGFTKKDADKILRMFR
ncbi:MAG: hypothetical protein IJX63_13555 [Lachnospiraceae bacterium]|nr:hypothetical protein [Lachnospiraceae bacterium]